MKLYNTIHHHKYISSFLIVFITLVIRLMSFSNVLAQVSPQQGGSWWNYAGGNMSSYVPKLCYEPDPPYGPHTYHPLWMNPYSFTVSSTATSINTNVWGASHVCANVGYSSVRNIIFSNISGAGVTLTGGNTMSWNGTSVSRGSWSSLLSLPASIDITGRSTGCHNYTLSYTVNDDIGGSHYTANGVTYPITICITRQAPDSGNCSINSKTPTGTLYPGQSFSASFTVRNTGGFAWPVGNRPVASGVIPDRYKLGSSNPQNNTRWTKTRIELPGESTDLGPIFYPGRQYTFTESGFVAPTSPGTYTFAWRIVQENVKWLGIDCTMNITVANPQVQAHVFRVDQNGNKIDDLVGVTLSNCGAGSPAQPVTAENFLTPKGWAYFSVPRGQNYCIRVLNSGTGTGNQTINGYDGPFIRPWGTIDGYYAASTPTPSRNSTNASLCTIPKNSPNYPQPNNFFPPAGFGGGPSAFVGHCANKSYENQVAGEYKGYQNFSGPETYFDRHTSSSQYGPDAGFDFVYVKKSPTVSCSIVASASMEPDSQAFVQIQLKANDFTTNTTVSSVTSPLTVKIKQGTTTLQTSLNVNYDTLTANNTSTTSAAIIFKTPNALTPELTIEGSLSPYFTSSKCGSITLLNKPYLSFYGGDACTKTTVNAFNSNGTPNYAGSGSQLATFAAGTISGFATAKMRSTSPTPPTGLMFASMSSPPCILVNGRDYDAPNSLTTWPGMTNLQEDGNYAATCSGTPSKATLSPSVSVPSGIKATLYVNCDLVISASIKYPTSYNGLSDVPSFTVIVQGNIYIGNGVKELNGTYIARSREEVAGETASGGGTIYTCVNATTTPPSPYSPLPSPDYASSLASKCNNQLKVYGALYAQRIRWWRMFGTVKDGSPTEDYNTLTNNAAEAVVDGPLRYLKPPISSQATNNFDAYTSLSPIL